MHYSIQQDLARNRVDDILRTANRVQLAAELRERNATEPKRSRVNTLLAAIQRRRADLRPLPVS
jgi:hypothetical protein